MNMTLSETDKRILIEVINNIHQVYASEAAFKESESTSITLPARLVRLSADVLGQSYRPEILINLDRSEIEMLLTSLFKSVEAMKSSLQSVMTALPKESVDLMRKQFADQLDPVAELIGAPPLLIESQQDKSLDELKPTELVRLHHELSESEATLNQVDLKQLREEVSQLQASVELRKEEWEGLQGTVAVKTEELDRLTSAIAETENLLDSHEIRARERLDQVLNMTGDLLDAVAPYLSRTETRIREAVETVADKVSEGKRLKTELQTRINEVSEVFEQTEQISAALSLYTQANQRVVRSVPTVVNVTKEKLSRVEEQLHEIDSQLKQALAQHQSAKHVAEMSHS
jgi:chromosome segregation ATPase